MEETKVPESSKKKKAAVKKKLGSENSEKSKKKAKAAKPKAKAQTKAKAPAKKAKTPAKAKAPAKPKAKAAAKKAKAPAKAKAKKVAPRKGKVSIKELLSRRFETGGLDKPAAKSPYKAKAAAKIPKSPPFVSGRSKKQVEQVRALLFRSFDLKEEAPAKKAKAPKAKAKAPAKKAKTPAKPKAKAPAKKAKTPAKPKAKAPAKKAKAPAKAKAKAPAKKAKAKKAAPRKGKVSIKELLFRRFETGVLDKPAAKSPYKAKAAAKIPKSPPFVSGPSEEVEQVRALLFRDFDLAALPEVEEIEEAAPVEEAFEAPVPPAAVLSKPKASAGFGVKLGLSGLAILMAIIIATSFSNRRSFFLKEVGGTVQVWQGKFAPTGSELILSLEGITLPNPIQDVYSKAQVYRLAFDHFQGKADELVYASMAPDFSKINNYLRQAAAYAPTGVERTMTQRRLDSMALLILFHRIDVALIKGTLPDLEAAKASLEKGAGLASSEYQRDLIAKRKAVLDSAISQLSK